MAVYTYNTSLRLSWEPPLPVDFRTVKGRLARFRAVLIFFSFLVVTVGMTPAFRIIGVGVP